MHTPVLLQQAIQELGVKRSGSYIDATAGEGGHLEGILKEGGKVLGIDWDGDQIRNLKLKMKNYKNLTLATGNFKDIEQIAKKHNFYAVDGVIFDLGLSMGQISQSQRGFSYKNLSEQLDMRINEKTEITAADLINGLNEEELYDVFSKYSEEIHSRLLAQTIVNARKRKKLNTVGDLLSVIDRVLQKKEERTYSRVFQALRIAVNNELKNLEQGMEGALNILKSKGKLLVITFHSVEDRIVKQFMNRYKTTSYSKMLFRKASLPSYARSAKLRVLVKN